MSTRAGTLLAAALSAVGLVAVLLASPAMAEISGPCAASINGENIAGRSTSATASPITVNEHSATTVSMTSARQISHLQVKIAFGGFLWTVHDEASSGTS